MHADGGDFLARLRVARHKLATGRARERVASIRRHGEARRLRRRFESFVEPRGVRSSSPSSVFFESHRLRRARDGHGRLDDVREQFVHELVRLRPFVREGRGSDEAGERGRHGGVNNY